MRRIVVTGLGVVTPLAVGVEASWSRLLAGCSGLAACSTRSSRVCRPKVGGMVPTRDDDPEAGFDVDTILPCKDQRKVDRFISLTFATEPLPTDGRTDTLVIAGGLRPNLVRSGRDIRASAT